jgi:hypothetical protein
MKKEICAIITLIALCLGAIGNVIHLNTLMAQITNHINYSLKYCCLEDYQAVHTEISKAISVWTNAENYTHVFIRHTEIDKMNDMFFDILSAVKNKERYESEYLLLKLQHHADTIKSMEQLSLGSIF